MEVKCDKCRLTFALETKTEGAFNGVEETYFECPECCEKYHCWYKNDKVHALETEREQRQARVANPNLRKEALKKVKELTVKITTEMEQLKITMGEKEVCTHDA